MQHCSSLLRRRAVFNSSPFKLRLRKVDGSVLVSQRLALLLPVIAARRLAADAVGPPHFACRGAVAGWVLP